MLGQLSAGMLSEFQSTPSVGRATLAITPTRTATRNFNPRPPWGGRQACNFCGKMISWISIHALRGEGDGYNPHRRHTTADISIHALRGEGDPVRSHAELIDEISIHALRGEGDVSAPSGAPGGSISIHALRGEGDPVLTNLSSRRINFNPRPPWGGRPHADIFLKDWRNFNPRPPWGGRRMTLLAKQHFTINFNPRPPWGGRLVSVCCLDYHAVVISIHALRGEGDEKTGTLLERYTEFQSTPSVGRATLIDELKRVGNSISIHALRGEGDDNPSITFPVSNISIHALRGEGDEV